MISRFTGFRGVVALCQIGKVQICILAKNQKQLEALWAALPTEAGPLDPDMCKRAVLIESNVLPPTKQKNTSPAINV